MVHMHEKGSKRTVGKAPQDLVDGLEDGGAGVGRADVRGQADADRREARDEGEQHRDDLA
jgi:hypothetical protein